MHDSCLDAAGARVTASTAIPIPTVCFTYLAYNDRQANYNKPYARARCKDRTGNYNKPFGAPFWFVKFLSVKSPLRDALFIFPVATRKMEITRGRLTQSPISCPMPGPRATIAPPRSVLRRRIPR